MPDLKPEKEPVFYSDGRLWGSSGGEIEFVKLVDCGDHVELHLTDHDHWPGENEVAAGAHYVLKMRKAV